MDKLVLVHLSDIHFTRASGVSVHDLDKNVRNELVLNATKVAKDIGPVKGVLITGDIAYSGREAEFEHATNWLRDFCRALGCPEESVWVVPGNHDVVRDKTKSKITRMLHQGVRQDGSDVDKELREIFSDAQSAAALLEPLADYNKFAGRFGCSISAEKHYWERDLMLACGTPVRLRGLTSALVSNEEDRRTGIVLGAAQATVERAHGVLHMTLCHHPPEWLRDHDAVEDHLKSKVHIQLFGHKHSQRIDEINGKVRLVAGAMHPDRYEGGWLPTYNFLEISRRDSDRIGLRVYQRQWNQPDTNFVAWRDPNNGKDHREFFWTGFPERTARLAVGCARGGQRRDARRASWRGGPGEAAGVRCPPRCWPNGARSPMPGLPAPRRAGRAVARGRGVGAAEGWRRRRGGQEEGAAGRRRCWGGTGGRGRSGRAAG